MINRSALRVLLLLLPVTILTLLIIFGSFYTYWNTAPPEKTCSSCHEIESSVNMFAQSSHRALKCSECHGTALSNGFHSIREKGNMIVTHMRIEYIEDIRLNHDQVLAAMADCKRCHEDEYADWYSGGHSASYHDIFMNRNHNEAEQINPDCLRCHGMFSDVPVEELVEPLDITGPWAFKIQDISDKPVIPCLACHQTHIKGLPKSNPDYSDPAKIFYSRKDSSEVVSLYYRPDRRSIPAGYLPKLTLTDGERKINISDDILMRLCVQCHAPNAHHDSRSSDDRTPTGVHEGLSCIACHEGHSNDAHKSCGKCHPAISNCNLDVTMMNTSYRDPESLNNIHWVDCVDCHKNQNPRLK
jgi:nitrate/TMAO reductase-like tetraheme cytochrome c subunit